MDKLICAIVLGGVVMGLTGCGGGSAGSSNPFSPPSASQQPPDNGGADPGPGDIPSKLTLRWERRPDHVIGYYVYYGATPDRGRMQQLPVPSHLNLAAPSVEFDILRDLPALPGRDVCFRVRAYSKVSESDFSQAVCAAI